MTRWIIIGVIFILLFGYMGLFSLFLIIIFYLTLNFLKKSKKVKKSEENAEKFIIELDEIIKNEYNKSFNLNDIDSYKEIIHSGIQDVKIEFIGMVVFNPSKKYVTLIKELLTDNDEIVRILASNSLQKMEDYFETKLLELNEKINVKNNTEDTININLELINIYDKYIQSTLLESFLIPEYEDKIFTIFDNLLKYNNKNIYDLYYELSVKYNRYETIIEKLVQNIKKDNQTSDIFLLAEIYYKQNKIKLLRTLLIKVNQHSIKSFTNKNSFDFWTKYAF